MTDCLYMEILMKKLLIMIFVGVLTANVFAAGKEEKNAVEDVDVQVNRSGMPIVNRPITVSLLAPRVPTHGDFEEMYLFKYITELTNLQFDITTVDQVGWEERKMLTFATGDLPDFFLSGLTLNDEMKYGAQGVLIALDEYIDDWAPNVVSVFKLYPRIQRELTTPDGHIYILPNANDNISSRVGSNRYYINAQWLENVGLLKYAQKPVLGFPNTLNEFYSVLRTFKNEDANGNGDPNDEIPVSGVYKDFGDFDGIVLSALGYVDRRIDVKDSKVVYVPQQPEFKEYLRFMNRLYSEGLLDAEYFDQTVEMFRAKASENLVGFLQIDNVWQAVTPAEYHFQFRSFSPLTSDWNSERQYGPGSNWGRAGTYAITSEAAYPEALVRLGNWFWSEDGLAVSRMGPKKGEWGREDRSGGWEIVLNEDGQRVVVTDPGPFENFRMYREQWVTPMSVPFWAKSVESGWGGVVLPNVIPGPDDLEYMRRSYWEATIPYAREGFPKTYFKPEEAEQINAVEQDLETYVQQMEAQFITGDAPLDAKWDEFLNTIKAIGVDEALKLRQGIYERYIGSSK